MPDRRTVAYLVAAAGDEAAAGVVRAAVERGAFGRDWVLGADGSETRARTTEEALSLVCASARASGGSRAGGGLEGFLEEARAEGVSRIVLFVPARPGPWLGQVRAALGRFSSVSSFSSMRATGVCVLVCLDGGRRPPQGGWAGRLPAALVKLCLRREPGEARNGQGELAAGLAEVTRTLGASGCTVEVVDRGLGPSERAHAAALDEAQA